MTAQAAGARMGWLLGWAVPEAWFASLVREVFPGTGHAFAAAGPEAVAQLEAAGPFDHLAGYSLGSLLLLREPGRAARMVRAGGRISLLAPIFAFPREEGLGGRVARAQVRRLERWLRTDPVSALADFYTRAGLVGLPVAEPSGLPAAPDLAWGLDRLAADRVEPVLPAGWRAWCGSADALLDAAVLAAAVPGVEIAAGATHHPAGLLRALAENPSSVSP